MEWPLNNINTYTACAPCHEPKTCNYLTWNLPKAVVLCSAVWSEWPVINDNLLSHVPLFGQFDMWLMTTPSDQSDLWEMNTGSVMIHCPIGVTWEWWLPALSWSTVRSEWLVGDDYPLCHDPLSDQSDLWVMIIPSVMIHSPIRVTCEWWLPPLSWSTVWSEWLVSDDYPLCHDPLSDKSDLWEMITPSVMIHYPISVTCGWWLPPLSWSTVRSEWLVGDDYPLCHVPLSDQSDLWVMITPSVMIHCPIGVTCGWWLLPLSCSTVRSEWLVGDDYPLCHVPLSDQSDLWVMITHSVMFHCPIGVTCGWWPCLLFTAKEITLKNISAVCS